MSRTEIRRIPSDLGWGTAVLLGITLVVGVVLRFVADSPLWLDEALSVNIASLDLGDIPAALRRDGHPPLYYFLLHGWIQLFGSGDFAVRALSGLLSVATLPVVWVAGRRYSLATAVWATILMAASPFAIRYATEARMYSLVTLEVIVGWLVMNAAWARRTPTRLAAVALVTALLVHTHYWCFFLLAATAIVLIVVGRRERSRVIPLLAAMAVGASTLVLWMPSFLTQLRHTGTPWGDAPRPGDVVWLTLTDFEGGPYSEPQLVAAIVIGLCVIALLGHRLGERLTLTTPVDPTVAILLGLVTLTLGLGWLVSAAGDSAFQSRYSAVVLPFVVLATAIGVSRFAGRWLPVLVVTVVLLGGWAGTFQQLRSDRTQADVLASVIERDGSPGDVVAYCPDQLGPALDRVLDGDFDQVTYPDLASPQRVDWTDYAERHANASPEAFAAALTDRARGAAIWLISRDNYKAVEDSCTEVVNILMRDHSVRTVLSEDGTMFYEPANLILARPRKPGG